MKYKSWAKSWYSSFFCFCKCATWSYFHTLRDSQSHLKQVRSERMTYSTGSLACQTIILTSIWAEPPKLSEITWQWNTRRNHNRAGTQGKRRESGLIKDFLVLLRLMEYLSNCHCALNSTLCGHSKYLCIECLFVCVIWTKTVLESFFRIPSFVFHRRLSVIQG